MIDGWALVHNGLWVVGAAIGLAALGMANYESQRAGQRLRVQLRGPAFQLWFSLGMVLFCLGLLFSSDAWWKVVIWSILSVAFAGQGLWLWWQQRTAHGASVSQTKVEPKPETPRSRSVRRLGWGLVLAGLFMLGAWAIVTGTQLFQHAQSLRVHLNYLEEAAQSGLGGLALDDLEEAGRHLTGLRQNLEAVQTLVGPFLPLGRLLAWLPEHGGDLAAASDLLQIATGVAVAGDEALQALSPALALVANPPTGADATDTIGQRTLPSLVAAQPQLEIARQELDILSATRAELDAQSLSPQVAGMLEILDFYLPWFEIAVDAGRLAPALLGAEGPRTYLVLAQNNHELRATGGFVSGVGELRIEGGRVASQAFVDSYAVDNLEVPHGLTPPAFQQTLRGDLFFFRDTNWDADFPTSAQRAIDVYAQDRGVQTHGAIALDLSALELLLDALGPVWIESSTEPVTGDNVVAVLQQQWANPASGPSYGGTMDKEWWLHRKDIMSEIAAAALNQLAERGAANPIELAQAIGHMLNEKHMLVYLPDPQASRLLEERNWDGALPNESHTSDFLMVVDTNVGFNKVDPNIARSIDYQVDLAADGSPRARLILTYRNETRRPVGACVQDARYGDDYTDMMNRCYWNYVRVYVPEGSHLIAGPDIALPPGSLLARTRGPDSHSTVSPTLVEGDWTAWAAFFDLAPGEERTLTFEYALPDGVREIGADGDTSYNLLVQKQPGTLAVPLHTTVMLPHDSGLTSAEPAVLFSRDADMLTAVTDLRTDRRFTVTFRESDHLP